MDRAALAKAKEDLNETRVKAPIAGRMSKRYVEKGDWVSAGGKLFRISDYQKIYLEAHVSDLDLAKLDVRKILKEGVDAEVKNGLKEGDVLVLRGKEVLTSGLPVEPVESF